MKVLALVMKLAHMYLIKSYAKIHIQLLGVFESKFLKFHILYIVPIIYQLSLYI
jgi:hypothetical protein